jgi:hypothetical protein
MADSPEQKRRKVINDETRSLVENFLKWCNDVGLVLNDKVLCQVQHRSMYRFTLFSVRMRSSMFYPTNSERNRWIIGFGIIGCDTRSLGPLAVIESRVAPTSFPGS